MAKRGIISPKITTISVVRRSLLAPDPGKAGARHGYTTVFTTRAEVKSRSGSSEWAQVDIDGKKVSDTFVIRYTTIAFDARDRVRDATGHIWQILAIEHVDLGRREMKLHCSNQGAEDVLAAR